MATLYTRGKSKYIWIHYYNKIEHKQFRQSTKIEISKEGWRKAELLKKQLEAGLVLATKAITNQSQPKGIPTIIIAFNHFKMNNSGKNKNTLYEYDWFFNKFKDNFPPSASCDIINKLSVEKWLSKIKKLKLSKNTIYAIMKVTKKFLTFLFEYNYAHFFKINRDVLVSPEIKEIIIFNKEDFAAIINGLNNKNTNFRIMIYLLIYTGLRPSDIINIKAGSIDFTAGQLKYYSQKTDKYFLIPLHPELLKILKQTILDGKTEKLFNYRDVKIMGKAFHRYLAEISLGGNGYNLRTFRKTFISFAHESGIDLASVSKLVGHQNISTTSKFYHKLSALKLSTELNKIDFSIKALRE